METTPATPDATITHMPDDHPSETTEKETLTNDETTEAANVVDPVNIDQTTFKPNNDETTLKTIENIDTTTISSLDETTKKAMESMSETTQKSMEIMDTTTLKPMEETTQKAMEDIKTTTLKSMDDIATTLADKDSDETNEASTRASYFPLGNI